ncbi:hypothetical protein C2E23DRAFT_885867 [Lenzites betulinus]|nr:hypothetical protein C2E23DRAFT_885867 [Lenzites betulinus]
MAVSGLGSFDEPIVLSDDEDATHVENELNRWNDSPSSSTQNSPVATDYVAYPPQSTLAPAPIHTAAAASKKRKRQECAVASGSVPSTLERRGKKKKQKQKAHQDPGHPGKSTPESVLQYELRNTPARQWTTSRMGADPYHPTDTTNEHVAMRSITAVDTRHPIGAPPYWSLDQARGYYEQYHAQHSSALYTSHDGPSRCLPSGDTTYPPLHPPPPPAPPSSRIPKCTSTAPRSLFDPVSSSVYLSQQDAPYGEVSSTLEESLRRLHDLSASLMAKTGSSATSTTVPLPVLPHTELDKRKIGRLNDTANAAHFDLKSPTLLPSPQPTLSFPVTGRTIVLAHLPKKFRNMDFVTKWARRFGVVARLELEPKPGKALVEYEQTAHAKAAFTSLRLRGEGREHIRVYWYKGTASSLSGLAVATDIEEGEIEEGEVVEVANVPVTTKPKKKKKGKKKAQAVERRLVDLVPVAPYQPTHDRTGQSFPSQVAARSVQAPFLPPRPPLEERFSDAPLIDTTGEEEMDMDSEDDYLEQLSVTSSPPLLTTVLAVPLSEADIQDWEVDMDVALSSPAAGFAQLPSPTTSQHASFRGSRSSSLSSADERRTSLAVSPLEPREPGQPHLATKPTELSNGQPAASTSVGSSATPEPATPDTLSLGPALASIIVSNSESIVSSVAKAMPSSHNSAINLDDLAVSFITETIQGVTALPPSPPKLPAPVSAHPLPSKPPSPTAPVFEPRTAPPAMSLSTPTPPQLSESVQLQARKKRLEQHITASKELLAKIAVAKTKSEKMMFMRLLKERQLAMDNDLRSGPASPSTPGARVAPATPTPVSKSTPFRWPQTAREMIIDISDSESDGAL